MNGLSKPTLQSIRVHEPSNILTLALEYKGNVFHRMNVAMNNPN